jgi:2-phospho-L-lactate guanylyltransferase
LGGVVVSWTAVVPLKAAATRKTRLVSALAPEARVALTDWMARHVIAVLGQVRSIERVLLLSPVPLSACDAEWIEDRGAGLNAELARVQAGVDGALLIVHADLPLLAIPDIAELLAAAENSGRAIASDRHGQGTNAIALFDRQPIAFAFGPGSFLKHAAQGTAAQVHRAGLSLDIDLPDDLAAVAASQECLLSH